MKGFHHFVCQCGSEIFFTNHNSPMVREWAKYHKAHMKKYLKAGSLKEAYRMIEEDHEKEMKNGND